MNKEMICKNCKYHYIEEISFDYPQSCCSKRMATTEGWCKCNDFEYSDRYIKQLQQENKKLNGAIQTYDILLKSNVEENKKMKKQLEEYKLQNINLRADIMIKKMALPNELIKDKTFYDLYDMPTYEELLAQQKEFIDYLGNEININPYDISDYDYEDIINTILSKYYEIIDK